MSQRRVVITGLGILAPVGNTTAEAWANLVAGRGGIGPLTRFDGSALTSQIAGELKDYHPENYFDKRSIRRMDPFIQYGIIAAREAVADSGVVIDDANAERVGVVYGSGIGGLQAWDDNYKILQEKGPMKVSPFLIPMLIGNMASGMVSIEFGAKGPSKSVQTACATSAHSAGDAMRLIQGNEADIVITGGCEAPIVPIACAGFCTMKALSTRNDDPTHASRPFDRERDGFVIAEGAAAIVLEDYEHAKARGANIYAELVGYGQSADAYHMAAPLPCGGGAARAMQTALNEAGIRPEQVDYVNAHATSTGAGDSSECHAIQTVFGDRLPATSASKSMTGHMLGAAGALELAICTLAIRDRVVPPTINYEYPDPECAIDCVPNTARELPVSVAISNSFGFGGHNCCLVARKI